MIYTYENQHADIKAGLQAKVNANAWGDVASDAGDLATLETLIAKAPTASTYEPRNDTVQVKPLSQGIIHAST